MNDAVGGANVRGNNRSIAIRHLAILHGDLDFLTVECFHFAGFNVCCFDSTFNLTSLLPDRRGR